MADIARLTQIIEPEAAALGLDLVRVKLMVSEAGDGALALQIMAEDPANGQLVIDQCAALSRRVSEVVDALEEQGETLVEGAYHLEVSSPGIDRPLTRQKDFDNWAGHEAKIAMVKGWSMDSTAQRNFRGNLVGRKDDQITLTDKTLGEVTLDFTHIDSAKLVLTDALIAATQPLDTSGADELVELDEKAES